MYPERIHREGNVDLHLLSSNTSDCTDSSDDLDHPHHHNNPNPHHSLQPYNRTRRRRRRWQFLNPSSHASSLCLSSALFLYLFSICSLHPTAVNSAKAPSVNMRNSGVDRECNRIGNVIRNKGFSYPWWDTSQVGLQGLITASTGNSSQDDATGTSGCPLGGTGQRGVKCCKAFDTTTQKNEMGSIFNDKWMGPKLAQSAEIFKERKKKFDVTFKDLLTRAHGSFHAMFERTYGMLYIQHAPIFHALFTTLETYYDTGRDSQEQKLNEFFAILTRKMFEVVNAQYDFDESYLSCATIVVSEKQGGDLHRQIVSCLRRSFVATRALAQGLSEADRVLKNLQKMKVPNDCLQSLSQMLHCPVCAEQRAFKPCLPLCTSVITKCLLSTASMNKPWTEFTSGLEGILDRLLGPYNVEAVVEPIHIKISEAIMNFQESGTDLSQAVFAKCGKPKLKSATRNIYRRSAPSSSSSKDGAGTSDDLLLTPIANMKPEDFGDTIDEEDVEEDDNDDDKHDTELMQGDRRGDAHRGGVVVGGGHHDDTQPSKSLEKLLKEIKNKVKKSKTLWNVLPKQVCNGISKDYSSQLCWNGSSAIKPYRNKSTEESESAGLPPGKGPPNLLVAEQVLILQLITDKLRASYNGLDVQWVQDVDELDFDGSGYGVQGSGFGDLPDDLEESDDDDPSGRIKPDRTRRPPPIIPSTTTSISGQRPKFPLRPAPPILHPIPHGNGRDEDEDDDDDDGVIRNWNIDTPTFHRPTSGGGQGGIGAGSDIDFAHSPPIPPYSDPFPPKFNHPPPPNFNHPPPPNFTPMVPFSIPTTTTTTTTTSTTTSATTTTRKPSSGGGSRGGDLDVKKPQLIAVVMEGT